MIAQILNLFNKELIQFRRDRLFTPFILLGPVLQLVMLAAATGSSISRLPVAIVDYDQSDASRELCSAFHNQWQLNVLPSIASVEVGEALVEAGRARMVVVIPRDFASSLSSALEDSRLQIIIDGSNAIVAQTLQGLSQGILDT
jgi:ABC-2 type transport system permease protein